MILYNEIMGVCAGLIMLIAASTLGLFHRGGDNLFNQVKARGYALLVLGTVLTPLAFLMTVTWPLTANPSTNIVFGQPTLVLGVLALYGGLALVRLSDLNPKTVNWEISLTPISWVLAGLGLVLWFIASAIWSYHFMGTPPTTEPITGQLAFWRNGGGIFTWGLMYALAGLGCVTTLFYRSNSIIAYHIIRWSWTISGAFFLVFAAMNYRTHIGQIINIEQGSLIHRW